MLRVKPYTVAELRQIIAVRASIESVPLNDEAVAACAELARATSLRFACQLLTPMRSALIAFLRRLLAHAVRRSTGDVERSRRCDADRSQRLSRALCALVGLGGWLWRAGGRCDEWRRRVDQERQKVKQ